MWLRQEVQAVPWQAGSLGYDRTHATVRQRCSPRYGSGRHSQARSLGSGRDGAGVFTRNRFCAAPVQVAKAHLADGDIRYLLINTGFANAGTGKSGMQDCKDSCQALAALAGCAAAQVLPFSTGVIGERLPVDRITAGIPGALDQLAENGWEDAARGIMTTDTRPKLAAREVRLAGGSVHIAGMAKGAGMIRPDMATMLAFIATDADVSQALLEGWVRELADESFNCVTIDGDTSTNDACILIATGQSGLAVQEAHTADAQALRAALAEIFIELAQGIVRDGEGATRFVTICVEGATDAKDARKVADTIAHSPLVKTAIFAGDPNWGRILAAVGRAPIEKLDIAAVNIWLDDVQIVKSGGVAPDYTEAAGARVMAQPEILIRVSLGHGEGRARIWTCDFSYDYVRINAEYRS